MKIADVLVVASLAAVLSSGPAAGQAGTPGAGCGNATTPCDVGRADPLRKILLDALRPAIESDLGQPVQFVVMTLRVQVPWAFAIVTPQTKAGREIDFSKTRHAERVRMGVFDHPGNIHALLLKTDSRWLLRDFAVGPTDVHYAGWPERFGVPHRLLGMSKPD
ncbi:MAG TPA: hypothetical protein VJ890_03540 [Vineibacter sp.]|nr:hypothetical protein [Vineibacter sp.]